MQIICEEVHGFNHDRMPDEKETIADSLDLNTLVPLIINASYYFRAPEDCPFATGNWILDVRIKDGKLLCFKFPKEMTENRFMEFLGPLLNRMRPNAH